MRRLRLPHFLFCAEQKNDLKRRKKHGNAKGWDTNAGGIASVVISHDGNYINDDGNYIKLCFNIGSIIAYDTDAYSADNYRNHDAGGITASGELISYANCFSDGIF